MKLLDVFDEILLLGVGQSAVGTGQVPADLAMGARHVETQILALFGLERTEVALER